MFTCKITSKHQLFQMVKDDFVVYVLTCCMTAWITWQIIDVVVACINYYDVSHKDWGGAVLGEEFIMSHEVSIIWYQQCSDKYAKT